MSDRAEEDKKSVGVFVGELDSLFDVLVERLDASTPLVVFKIQFSSLSLPFDIAAGPDGVAGDDDEMVELGGPCAGGSDAGGERVGRSPR